MNLQDLGVCSECALQVSLWVLVSSFDIGLALVFDVKVQAKLGARVVGDVSAAVIGEWQLISNAVVAEEVEFQSLQVLAISGNEAPSCESGEVDCTMLFLVDAIQISTT